ncbi:riboflavin kinase/FMN adenylyltransferase [Lipingzhangella halophila]|uniref:Riboflavin biosynthesis protein n=1 Tax=Lipingzhangella halophila TaxID=1783352 RepID=A0A7W7RK46_9ACTN|nr:bifunctional riboflavin kinase/FAD synthetase [Lipingzhangella halophila]MBB4933444.1 riboflavin kinase/FMN adenylyltransferase [Lipingzhangella halophila]
MRSWRGLADIPDDWGRSVVTIGVFDGVHRGHQSILSRASERARELGLPVVAVTFDPHPDSVVRGLPHPAVLTPQARKAHLLAEHGADAVCVLPFTPELAALSAEEFVRRVLVDRLRAAAVVVGENFRFGHKAAGDIGVLQTLGEKYDFAADGVRLVSDPGTETITSTLIRRLLENWQVEQARHCLGRPHRVEGRVVHGAARGRELLGFPTANLECAPDTAIPADGVYAGWLLRVEPRAGEESSWPAAVSVGTNPTFEGSARSVEAYALDRDDLDLYGESLGVEFASNIRPMVRFDSVAELIEAMQNDVERARELLSGA